MQHHTLLVTGAPHSGTRLLQNMLAKHSDIAVPSHILNKVGEFYPLHVYFMNMINATSLHNQDYYFDFEELAFILDSYMQEVDNTKPFAVLKMPYYPLNCLEFLHDYFNNRLTVLYTSRSVEKVVSSYSRRGAEVIFNKNPQEHIRQVKKLPVELRRKYLTEGNKNKLIQKIIEETEQKKTYWNQANPGKEIITVHASELAKSPDYFKQLLKDTGIPVKDMDEIYSVLNKDRLMVGTSVKIKDVFWKYWSRLKENRRNRG